MVCVLQSLEAVSQKYGRLKQANRVCCTNLFKAKLACSAALFDFQIGPAKDGIDDGRLRAQHVDGRVEGALGVDGGGGEHALALGKDAARHVLATLPKPFPHLRTA